MRSPHWTLLPIIAWALVAAADTGEFTLANVLERVRPDEGRFASAYRQTRASTLLTEAVHTRGRIVFTPPDRLRRTEHGSGSGRTTIEVHDGTVRVDDGDSVSQYPLAQAPTLALLMDVLGAVAAADAERLRTELEARLNGDWGDWRIELDAPVPAAATHHDNDATGPTHAHVTIAGTRGRVATLMIDSPHSGRIEIHFTGAGNS